MTTAPRPTDDLMQLTNSNLLRHGLGRPNVTVLENELLHRLEAYISMYGDYLDVKARERD